MNLQVPSSRRDRDVLLKQLPGMLQERMTAIISTAKCVERVSGEACWEVTADYLEDLRQKVSDCRMLEALMLLWRDVVRVEMYMSGDDWDKYDKPMDPDDLTKPCHTIYCAARSFDSHSKEYEVSSELDDRLTAPLLWDCGTVCDRMLVPLNTLRNDASDAFRPLSISERPTRPVEVKLTVVNHIINKFDGGLTLQPGSTLNGDVTVTKV